MTPDVDADEIDLDDLREAIDEARTTGDLRRLNRIKRAIAAMKAWKPQGYQLPPPGWGSSTLWAWLFAGGRGSGKSDTGAHYTNEHMTGPACDPRVPGGHKAFIGGPTFGTAIDGTWKAPHGISAHNPKVEKVGRKEGTYYVWPNGAEAAVAGMHTEQDAEQVRAHAANTCFFWLDEAAIARWLKLALDNLLFGCRLGDHPGGMVTSTPKPTPAWKYLLALDRVLQTRGSSYDNAYLPDSYRALIAQYEGTAWGLQEIHGELVESFEGALWQRDQIDLDRVPRNEASIEASLRALEVKIVRILIGVDPSTWSPEFGDDPGTVGQGLETGIVPVGVDDRPQGARHGYVLDDASSRFAGPAAAAKEIVRVYNVMKEIAATMVVLERNNHGGMYDAVRLIDESVPFYRDPTNPKRIGVHASDSKRARAEPVSALYEQHRIHHLGDLPVLEGQYCLWDPRENWSPDRLDAAVWAITAHGLIVRKVAAGSTASAPAMPFRR